MTDVRPDRPGRGAVLVGVVAGISPFDIGRPVDGWTELHLRPLLLATAAVAVATLIGNRERIDRPLALATVVLVAGFAIASAASPDPWLGMAVTVRVAVLGLVFSAAAAALPRAVDRRALVAGVAIGAGLASLIGLAVLALGGDRFGTDLLLGSISVSRGVTRLTRPFSHANVAAMYLAPAVVLVAAAASSASTRVAKAALTIVAVVASAALSLTLSRSGLVAVVVAASALALARLRFPAPDHPAGGAGGLGARSGTIGRALAVRLPLVVVVTVVGVGALSGRWGPRLDPWSSTGGPAARSRSEVWSQAVDAVVDHPLTGVGPGRFGVYSLAATPSTEAAAAHAHNPVLEALATGGLVAVAGVAVFAVVVAVRSGPGFLAVPLGLSAALVAAMLPMVADNPFLFSSSGNLVALVGGAWYSASRNSIRMAAARS